MTSTTLHELGSGNSNNSIHGQEFPHHVSIMDRDNYACAGSIIKTMMILTTAHCLQDKVANNLKVIAGPGQRSRDTLSNHTQIRNVQALLTHEHFAKGNDSPFNDIGVLLLNHPLEYTEYVQNVSLPQSEEEFEGNITLVGWEYVSSSGFWMPNQQRKVVVVMPIISNEVCVKNYSDNLILKKDTRDIMCVGESVSNAKQDFEGGAVCYRNNSKDAVLCGVVSCRECRGEFGSPAISVKVSRFLDWIENSRIKLVEKNKCRSSEFFCFAALNCISRSLICNGIKDCSEGEDEIGCDSKAPCDLEQYRCRNGNCIQKQFLCDGYNDCRDGSDEAKCPTRKKHCTDEEHRCHNGRCIPNEFRCDQNYDCDDDSDEDACFSNDEQNPSTLTTALTFPEEQREQYDKRHKCTTESLFCSSRCLNRTFICDGQPNCEDGTDELNCSKDHISSCNRTEFRCNNGLCRARLFLCDGYDDCGDRSDEIKCPRVYRQCEVNEFQCGVRGRCIPSEWKCDRFQDCDDNSDEINCKISSTERSNFQNLLTFLYSATSSPPSACNSTQFRCENSYYENKCISINRKCDGESDCPGGEDEQDCTNGNSNGSTAWIYRD